MGIRFLWGKEHEFWKTRINKLELASRKLLCFPFLLKVPVGRSLDDTEISQNTGFVGRSWNPKQGRTFSFWSTIPPMFAFSAFFILYWQRYIRICLLKTKESMNKVFRSIVPQAGHGLFFFSLSLLGWVLKKHSLNPNSTAKPKVPEQVLLTCWDKQRLISFSKRGQESDLKRKIKTESPNIN